MHFSITMKVLGLLLMLFSSAMVAPLVIALLNDDQTITGFLAALAITFFSGLLLWAPEFGSGLVLLPFGSARESFGARRG